jgi:hypothetical protein
MPEDHAVEQLRTLDAVAAEQDMLMAFRVCEESEELEPVFMRVFRANGESEKEAVLLAICDQDGLPLGRYVIPSRRLEAALDDAEYLGEEMPAPTVVPAEWGPRLTP